MKKTPMPTAPGLIVICAECKTANAHHADFCVHCNNPLNGVLLNAAAAAVAGQAYVELLMAVERKFPGESRHQTALRYIRETERRASSEAAAVAKYFDPCTKVFGDTVSQALQDQQGSDLNRPK